MMVETNAKRQADYRDRLKKAAYQGELQAKQIAAIETALNEVRAKVGLAEIQLPKAAT